jgi:hypothetical protein
LNCSGYPPPPTAVGSLVKFTSRDNGGVVVPGRYQHTAHDGGGGDGGGGANSGTWAIKHASQVDVDSVTVDPEESDSSIDTGSALIKLTSTTSVTTVPPAAPNNAALFRKSMNLVAFTADPFDIATSSGGTASVGDVATDTTVGCPRVDVAGDVALVATFAGPEDAVGMDENADKTSDTNGLITGGGTDAEVRNEQNAPPTGVHSVDAHTDASDCTSKVTG